MSDLAHAWQTAGQYFAWCLQQAGRSGDTLQIFYRCLGDPTQPAIVMLHGFPTSSYDFHTLALDLSTDHYVCLLDFPGFGFSDKPLNGYGCTMRDNAQLVDFFVHNIVGLQRFALFTHDRGDSVGLALLTDHLAQQQMSPITHHFMTNGNMYLPLANLTDFQQALRNPQTSQAAVASVTAPQLAATIGQTCFTPPVAPDDPEILALTDIIAYGSGLAVLPVTIKYLDERAQSETGWLESVQQSPIPTTLIWGIHDTIAPVRVADYIWNTFLSSRIAPSAYWLLPCANHYPQHDQPAALAHIVRLSLSEESPADPIDPASDPCAAVFVERGGSSHQLTA